MPAIDGVVKADAQPLGGAYVRLIGPSEEFVAEIYTKDDGVFRFHVAEGSWRIETRAAGRDTVSRSVQVDDADVSVTLDL